MFFFIFGLNESVLQNNDMYAIIRFQMEGAFGKPVSVIFTSKQNTAYLMYSDTRIPYYTLHI